MHHSSIGSFILEMKEPVFAILGMHPSSLMRAIDSCFPLRQNNLMLVRSIGRLASHSQLETCRHTTGRTHDPIPAIALIELRSLTSTILCTITIKDNDRLPDGSCSVSRQLPYSQHTGKLGPRIGPAIHEIAPPVIIPKRCRIDIPLSPDDTNRILPFTGRVFGLYHIHAIVRIAPIDIVLTIVVSDRWCPDAVTMLRRTEMRLQCSIASIERLQRIADNLPIHQVGRMKNGQARHTIKR